MLRLPFLEIAKSERIERGDRPGAHRKNIAVDTPYPRRSALERLDSGRVIMALDLEYYPKPIPYVHQSGILFTGLDQHLLPFTRQGLQPLDGILITAMLAPHGTKGA